jgi:predicted transcriptional regulator
VSDFPLLDFIDHGRQSSQETLAAITPTLSERRQEVLAAIVAAGAPGITLDELSQRFDVPAHSISGRITELKKAGLVRHTGERRRTRSGCSAAVIVAEVSR